MKIEDIDKQPDVAELKGELLRSFNEENDIETFNKLEDTRLCRWAGQTQDGRKHAEAVGQKVFPFEGASDIRVPLADGIIRRIVDILTAAQQRAVARVQGVELQDSEQAATAGTLLNWARNRISNSLGKEAMLLANYAETYGYALGMVTWDQEVCMRDQEVSLEQIMQLAQGAEAGSPLQMLPEMIADADSQDAVVELIRGQFPQLAKRELGTMVKELRETGSTSFPTPYVSKNQPKVIALKPLDDFVVPPETISINSARAVFRRCFHTEAEVRAKVLTDDWNEEWVEKAVENKGRETGVTTDAFNLEGGQLLHRRDNLVEVWYAYYKTVDKDGIPSVMYTVFSNQVEDDLWAKHGRLDYAHGELPFVEFKSEEFARRLIESRGVPEVCKDWQRLLKTQLDSVIDYTSFSTLPAITFNKRMGGAIDKFGPAVQIPVTRPDDIGFMAPPSREPRTAFELDAAVRRQAYEYYGLPHADVPQPSTQLAQQAKVSSWLRGWTEIYRQMLRLCLQYLAPDELVRITGVAAASEIGMDAHKFDLICTFSVDEFDYSIQKEKLGVISSAILPSDSSGRIDRAAFTERLLRAVVPESANDLLLSPQNASKEMYANVKQDLANMMLGIEAEYSDASKDPAAATKLQMVQELVQKTPSIQQAMQSNELFGQLLQNYTANLQQGIAQEQNKMIGRQGVAPIQQ
jgi:hypothetical protein